MNTKKLTVLMCGALAMAGPANAQSGFEAAEIELRFNYKDFEDTAVFTGGVSKYGALSGAFSYLLSDRTGFQLGLTVGADDSDTPFESDNYIGQAHLFFDASDELRLGTTLVYSDEARGVSSTLLGLEGIYYNNGLRAEVGLGRIESQGSYATIVVADLAYEIGNNWVGLFDVAYETTTRIDQTTARIGLGYDISEDQQVFAYIGRQRNTFGAFGAQDVRTFEFGFRRSFGANSKAKKLFRWARD